MKISIWWIRRDLRIQRNPALEEALANSEAVIPLYILDARLLSKKADKRLSFLFEAIASLDRDLREQGSQLWIKSGDPATVLQEVVNQTGAEAVFAEADYSPYARQRDQQIAYSLPLWLVHGLTIFPPGVVVKETGCPYTVFTHFSRVWKSLPLPGGITTQPLKNKIPSPQSIKLESVTLPAFTSIPNFPANEKAAQDRIDHFIASKLYQYADLRDRMDLDGTSRLSPYLRFGLLSPLYTVQRAMAAIDDAPDAKARLNAETWLNELIWREFYISVLHHFPEVLESSFRRDLRNIKWRKEPHDFDLWKNGLTGYPVVDAGMRQLKESGWMHNRARMITASFLVKDLLINWQDGEAWFMENLIDGDPAANNGGWQWTSGVGTDAAPYFRIFNPVLQGEKFDPSGDYIRRWVPELTVVPAEYIHKPWLMPDKMQDDLGVKIGEHYPFPMVDHREVKSRTLAAYATGEPRAVMDGCPS